MSFPMSAHHSSNLADLREEVEKLDNATRRLHLDVGEAHRQGDEIHGDFQKWLTSAELMIQTAKELIKDSDAANPKEACCQGSRRQVKEEVEVRDVGNLLEDISKLLEDIKLERVSHRLPPQGIRSLLRGFNAALGSRVSISNQIMKALKDDGIKMVGVWGMGGVGKTIVAKQVALLAEENHSFDKVVMVSDTSQVPDVTKIQERMATMLGFKYDEQDEFGRAVRLYNSLKKHKRLLVILDNIWEELSLERIGIPFGNVHEGCKVLLTSRYHDLLLNCMGTEKNFHVTHLCEEEAWTLLTSIAGDSVEDGILRPVALQIVKECEGLPLAIVTIAKALRGKRLAEWEAALLRLKTRNLRGVSERAYSCLEQSYNHLKGDEVKQVFLLCGMMGIRQIKMNCLLQCVIGLNLFPEIYSLDQVKNEVVTAVQILRDSSLLLDVEDGDGLEMSGLFLNCDERMPVRTHKLVCDVAREIASKDNHQFMAIEASAFADWQRKIDFTNCSHISLTCSGTQSLPERLMCPKLVFFLLDDKNTFLDIPDTFFEGMKHLKVLSLSNMQLGLASSFRHLCNLQTLHLHKCTLGNLEILGGLKNLRVISFAGSTIEQFPEVMRGLNQLRVLDLWKCVLNGKIPRDVISSLSRLEYLCLPVGGDSCIGELKRLSHLRILDMQIMDHNLIPISTLFGNLIRYRISIGAPRPTGADWPEYAGYKSPRRLKLEVKSLNTLNCFFKLLKTTEVLELWDLEDFCELNWEDFLELKHLQIADSPGIHNLVGLRKVMKQACSVFPILEELNLWNLINLDAVSYGPFPKGCFGSLRYLRLGKCTILKHVISLPTEQGRDSLFPHLQFLGLECLPELINFCCTGSTATDGPCTSDAIQIPFFNEQVTLPTLESLHMRQLDGVRILWQNQLPAGTSFRKLETLDIEVCNRLQNVIPSNFLRELQSLKVLKIAHCSSLDEIFYIELVRNEEIHETAAARPLRGLLRSYLDCLKNAWNNNPRELLTLRNLRVLEVFHCPRLKTIFPAKVAKGLVQLEVLAIGECGVEEIVADENGDIFFPKLTSLSLYNLEKLKALSRGTRAAKLPLLKDLKVHDCDRVEILFQGTGLGGDSNAPTQHPFFLVEKDAFPSLEELSLKGTMMKIWQGQFSTGSFRKLRVLKILDCHDILAVIPPNMLHVLDKMEELSMENCSRVKEIVSNEGGEATDRDLVFTKLQQMTLCTLPNLKSFCPASYSFEFPSLEVMTLMACSQMESLCVTFPNSIELRISMLPQLIHQCLQIPGLHHQNLWNIQRLEVGDCQNLMNLVTPLMAKCLVQLKELCISCCDTMREVVGHEEDDVACYIAFSNLRTIRLSDLPKLKSFCSARHTFNFPSLEVLNVVGCHEMQFFCEGDFSTPSLEKLTINGNSQWGGDHLNIHHHQKYIYG